MSRSRPALGNNTGSSEPFGTRSSEPFQTPIGRPPVLDDAALLTMAQSLNTRLGRPPKADELIMEAGGCQKKRALAAIGTLRVELANREVRSQLQLPSCIDNHLRSLMGEWLDLAARQLAQQQADFSEDQERRRNALLSQNEELQDWVSQLRRTITGLETTDQERLAQIAGLTGDCNRLRAERDATSAVAIERQRMLQNLVARTTNPATTHPADS